MSSNLSIHSSSSFPAQNILVQSETYPLCKWTISTRTGSFCLTLANPAPSEDIGLAPRPPTAESKYDGTPPDLPAAITTLSQSIGHFLIRILPPKPADLLTSSATPAISNSVLPRPPESRIASNIERFTSPLCLIIDNSQSDFISLNPYRTSVQSCSPSERSFIFP